MIPIDIHHAIKDQGISGQDQFSNLIGFQMCTKAVLLAVVPLVRVQQVTVASVNDARY